MALPRTYLYTLLATLHTRVWGWINRASGISKIMMGTNPCGGHTPKSWRCLVELNIFSSNHVHHKLIFLKVWNKISITDRLGNILPRPPDFHRVNFSNLVRTVPTSPICSGGPNWRSTFSSLAKNLGEGLNNLFGTNYTYILTSYKAHKQGQVLFGVAF